MVDIGKLDRRFSVLKPNRTQNDFGETTITYDEVAQRWGSLRLDSGRDRDNASQISSEVSGTVVMRKDSQLGIQPDWRLSSQGRTFEIRDAIDADDRGRFWEMEVFEVPPV